MHPFYATLSCSKSVPLRRKRGATQDETKTARKPANYHHHQDAKPSLRDSRVKHDQTTDGNEPGDTERKKKGKNRHEAAKKKATTTRNKTEGEVEQKRSELNPEMAPNERAGQCGIAEETHAPKRRQAGVDAIAAPKRRSGGVALVQPWDDHQPTTTDGPETIGHGCPCLSDDAIRTLHGGNCWHA